MDERNGLKNETEQTQGATELPDNVKLAIEIAKQIDKLELQSLPRQLVFSAVIQPRFGKVEL